MDIKTILKEYAYRDIPLWYDQAYELGCYVIEGCGGSDRAMMESLVALSALHHKSLYAHQGDGVATPTSAAEQIAGICAAVFIEDIGVSEFGFVKPNVPYVMDNCGMGGDLITTANISTLAALIAATAGIPMCKHGSPANADKGRHGSSDFVSLCGINPFSSKHSVERSTETHNFGYTEALDTRYKRIHLQTHEFASLPHMNDIIGPITNPVHPTLMTRRVLGVNHLLSPKLVAEVYQILNRKGLTSMEHFFALRGFIRGDSEAGMDELSICQTGTTVAELRDGVVQTYRLTADDFGVSTAPVSAISPPEGVSKGDFSLQILNGERNGEVVDMVCANAAILFHLADPSLGWRAAYAAARDTFATGNVPQTKELVAEVCV